MTRPMSQFWDRGSVNPSHPVAIGAAVAASIDKVKILGGSYRPDNPLSLAKNQRHVFLRRLRGPAYP